MAEYEDTDLRILDWGRLDYGAALGRQKELVAARITGQCADHLIFVEHPPVITFGRSGDASDLCVSQQALRRRGISLFRVERGGRATFHGPGQVVVYPIIRLQPKDLHLFLARLLKTAVHTLESFGLAPQLRPGQPGVWVNGAKIASVGIAVRRWVTFHGLALNVNADLEGFGHIVPCGQPAEMITSMLRESGETVALSEVKTRFEAFFRRLFGYPEARKPKRRHPDWLVRPAVDLNAVNRMARRLERLKLATVCQSAHCPNLGECFGRGTATFMILGTRCTRRCRFCAVEKGAPLPVDVMEPVRVARAVKNLGLSHVVVTSVTRDDLPDGGAPQFAQTIDQIRKTREDVGVEVLVPDFMGSPQALQTVFDAWPDVFNHNIETVPRLYAHIRPQANYRRSLSVLSRAAARGLRVKSGLMLGLGETASEVRQVLQDLKSAGCQALTLGQYLAPSAKHAAVARHIPPDEFDHWAVVAGQMGFASVASAPLVRSSYRADAMQAAVPSEGTRLARKERITWKASASLSKSAQVSTCTAKMPPRPPAGP